LFASADDPDPNPQRPLPTSAGGPLPPSRSRVWPAGPFGGDSQPTQLQRAVSVDQVAPKPPEQAPTSSERPGAGAGQPTSEPPSKPGDNTVLMAAPSGRGPESATGEKQGPDSRKPDAERNGTRRTSPSR
jgi:hypothetical protein